MRGFDRIQSRYIRNADITLNRDDIRSTADIRSYTQLPMVPKMIIERATIADAEEILFLQKLAYQSEAEIYNDFNISPLIQTLEEIKREFKNKIFLKATVNGKIIGSVRAFTKEETCYIERLIVHPDFQNQGIGTNLMNEIEKFFRRAKRFELFTGHKSKRNIYLYQKCGYMIFRTEKITDNLEFIYLEKTSATAYDTA